MEDESNTTREFVDMLTQILSDKRLSVVDQLLEICSRMKGTYIPSPEYVLRHERIRQVLELHLSGRSVRDISRKVNLKKSAIYKIIRDSANGQKAEGPRRS